MLPPEMGLHRERLDLFNHIFDLRSKAVHGDADSSEIKEWVVKAENALSYSPLVYGRLALGSEPKDCGSGT